MVNKIEAGETYDFEFTVSGDASGFSGTMNVLQYPGATPTISRAMTKVGNAFKETLTSVETIALYAASEDKSLPWRIHGTTSDIDEDIRDPEILYITKGWVS
tara:strand:- start:21 stop:326 length:306 start_codon:yes stop_codon:yes gene_type:complete